jgi:hypothetical protein
MEIPAQIPGKSTGGRIGAGLQRAQGEESPAALSGNVVVEIKDRGAEVDWKTILVQYRLSVGLNPARRQWRNGRRLLGSVETVFMTEPEGADYQSPITTRTIRWRQVTLRLLTIGAPVLTQLFFVVLLLINPDSFDSLLVGVSLWLVVAIEAIFLLWVTWTRQRPIKRAGTDGLPFKRR